MKERRIIRITKNQIFLTPETCINLSDTSLKGESLGFRAAEDIYWEIEINSYHKEENIVEVTVIDYDSKNFKKLNNQTPKDKAPFIKFHPLSWKRVKPHLSWYAKRKLETDGIIYDDDEQEKIKFQTFKRWDTPPKQIISDEKKEVQPSTPINKVVSEIGKVYFKKVEFHLGYAEFSYKVERLNFTLKLKIENEFLKPEFNNIKSYFPKVLGVKKQFSINVKITIENNKIIHKQTTSDAIERIDTTVIDSIERVRVNKITSLSLRKKTNKSLFTSDEILESFENSQDNKTEFKQSEKEILDLIVKVKKSRNSTHLQFLSGSKQSKNQKLKFTLKPHFGFLFFIECIVLK